MANRKIRVTATMVYEANPVDYGAAAGDPMTTQRMATIDQENWESGGLPLDEIFDREKTTVTHEAVLEDSPSV